MLQSKKGDVSAELLVGTKADDPKSVLVSFTAPYKLETGGVYDGRMSRLEDWGWSVPGCH